MTTPLISELLRLLREQGFDLRWYAGKRVLVTGGAGFIGSWLVETLVKLDSHVLVVDDLSRGSLRNLKSNDGQALIDISKQFLQGDLRDPRLAGTACEWAKPDLVFHLADVVAGVDYVLTHESEIFNANVRINSNTFAALRAGTDAGLVYVGTACSYPRSLQRMTGAPPLTEDQTFPADPESAYGWSKLMGEYEAELFAKETRRPVGILRLHNVYGPRAILSMRRSQVIPSLIRKAARYPEEDFVVWGSGQQTRDFVFVCDVIEALLRVAVVGMGKGVIQISTASETSVSDLAALIVVTSGKRIPISFDRSKPEGDRGRSGDYSRAKRLLGWEPRTSLERGIKATYEWAREELLAGVDLEG